MNEETPRHTNQARVKLETLVRTWRERVLEVGRADTKLIPTDRGDVFVLCKADPAQVLDQCAQELEAFLKERGDPYCKCQGSGECIFCNAPSSCLSCKCV